MINSEFYRMHTGQDLNDTLYLSFSLQRFVHHLKLGQDLYFLIHMQEHASQFQKKKHDSCRFNKCNTCFGKQKDLEQSGQ